MRVAIRRLIALMPAALAAAGMSAGARAERIVLAPGADLQARVDAAGEGDVLLLAKGEYRGPVRIARRLTIEGAPGAILVGNGRGSVITVSAPGAIVRGLTIRGSGRDLDKMDAGVFVEQTAAGAIVENNEIDGNLYGIYLHGAPNALARGNKIRGLETARVNDAGNGVSVWNAPGAKVIGNDIRFGRDGIFVVTSRNNVFSRNRFSGVRFAIHYMYADDSVVSDNISIGNSIGFAIMFSNRLTVTGNISDGDRDQGFSFNYANGSRIASNLVRGRMLPIDRWASPGIRPAEARAHGLPQGGRPEPARGAGLRPGPEKCVFMYNANKNRFRDNWFEGCDIGIHFTAGSEGNEISGNAFVNNRKQVKYVGTRHLDWSKDGRGNYWSDNPGFDLDGDGIADTAYRPNDLVDVVLWTTPQAKLLVNSPAIQIIRWAQAQFPALLPGGVVDTHPLISPPPRPRRVE